MIFVCYTYHHRKAHFLCWMCLSRYLYISDHLCLRGPFLHGIHCYVRFVCPSTMTMMTRPICIYFCHFMKYILVVGVNCHVLSVHPFFLLLCFKLIFVSKNLKLSSPLNISQWLVKHICALPHFEPRSELAHCCAIFLSYLGWVVDII